MKIKIICKAVWILRITNTLVILDTIKDTRDESRLCLSGVKGYVSIIFRWLWHVIYYKFVPHEAVARSSFPDSSDNEGIPCSDFPCSTQPGGKFFLGHSFLLQVSWRTAGIIFNQSFRIYIFFILFYASVTTDHKSHKAINDPELSVHIHN